MRFVCQILLLIFMVSGFVLDMKHTIDGREETPPLGFIGAMFIVIAWAFIAVVCYHAGLFEFIGGISK